MNNEVLSNRILEKVQDRIAIFQFEKEDNNMKRSTKKFANIVAILIMIVGLSVGTVYAGNVIYEKIWKEPTKLDVKDDEITDEIIGKNVTEEYAKKVAQDKLIQVGLENEEIIGTDHYRLSGTDAVDYRFITDNWAITIDGQTGEFSNLLLNTYDKSVEEYTMSRNEAITVAKEYYKKLGYQEGEYELAELVPLWDYGEDHGENYSGNYSARFYKKYGDLYNMGERVWIEFYAKDHKLHGYSVGNSKCEDNAIKITKEEAIQIATNEDRKVENRPIIRTNAELKIRSMNGNAYARLNNTEEYYKPRIPNDGTIRESITYKTDGRIRKVWVVVFEYSDEGTDIVDKVTKGQYSYFVDATTGEIIGGETSDSLRYENYWLEKNK